MPVSVHAQSVPADSSQFKDAIDRVTVTFEEGNPERLFAASAQRVDLSLLGSRSYYSRSQAFYVMRDFFRQYTPTSFVVDRTAEADASLFVMGTLYHNQADHPAHVMVRFDESPTVWVLHELRIEVERP